MEHGDIVRPVRDRVRDVLADDTTRAFIEGDYLRRLLDEGSRTQEQTDRSLARMVTLAGLFMLLAQASVSKVSLSGLEITDLRPIQIVLPVIVMSLVLQVCIGTTTEMALFRTADWIVRERYPRIHGADLQALLHPRGPAGVEYLLSESDSTWRGGVLLYSNAVVRIFAILAAAAFEVYAYWRNFTVFGTTNPLLWLAMGVTVVFAVRATAVFRAAEHTPLFGGDSNKGM